jgi:hypothetical protein
LSIPTQSTFFILNEGKTRVSLHKEKQFQHKIAKVEKGRAVQANINEMTFLCLDKNEIVIISTTVYFFPTTSNI